MATMIVRTGATSLGSLCARDMIIKALVDSFGESKGTYFSVRFIPDSYEDSTSGPIGEQTLHEKQKGQTARIEDQKLMLGTLDEGGLDAPDLNCQLVVNGLADAFRGEVQGMSERQKKYTVRTLVTVVQDVVRL
jgi:hypothetical protein